MSTTNQSTNVQDRSLTYGIAAPSEGVLKRTERPYFVLDGNVCALFAARDHVNLFLYDDAIVPGPEKLVTGGQNNEPLVVGLRARWPAVPRWQRGRYCSRSISPRGSRWMQRTAKATPILTGPSRAFLRSFGHTKISGWMESPGRSCFASATSRTTASAPPDASGVTTADDRASLVLPKAGGFVVDVPQSPSAIWGRVLHGAAQCNASAP